VAMALARDRATVGETDFAAAVVMRSASTPGALPGCSPVAAWARASAADEPPLPARSPPPVPSRETEEEAKLSPQANSWDEFIFESRDVPPPPTLDTSVAATSWAAERREHGRPLLDELLEIREQHGEKVGQGDRGGASIASGDGERESRRSCAGQTGNGKRGVPRACARWTRREGRPTDGRERREGETACNGRRLAATRSRSFASCLAETQGHFSPASGLFRLVAEQC
jgi:hypothetical protein